jgi:hypothetical protein
MLSEARKREKAANAFLAATMALSAAQSPKDFVRTGHVESPGTALMQRWGRIRGEAERNLDSGRVVARNRKKKTFREFLEEAATRTYHSSKSELLGTHGGKLPEGHRPGYRAGKGWFSNSIADEKKAKERREGRKKPLTQDDFHSYAKRNLVKKPKEFAAIAADREEHAIDRTYKKAKTTEKKSGVKQHVDHIQPLSQEKRRLSKEHKARRYAISPGHSAQNLEVATAASNIQKGDAPPKKGERGSNFTRSGAIRHTAKDTHKFIKKLDSEISSVRHSPAERMAKAYDKITGLPPEKPKDSKQTPKSSTSRVPSPKKISSRSVPPPRKISSRNVPPPIKRAQRG